MISLPALKPLLFRSFRYAAPRLMAVLIGMLFLLAPEAMATPPSNDTPVGDMFCMMAGWATGNTGKGIESIAMIILGITAMLGRLAWDKAALEIVGIATLYCAAAIVTSATGGTVTSCT